MTASDEAARDETARDETTRDETASDIPPVMGPLPKFTERFVRLIDIERHQIRTVKLTVSDGRIAAIEDESEMDTEELPLALPGYVDAHVHIESSMLVPSEFARLAVVHGTVATVSDPHEIANVLGIPGIDFMIDNGRKVPFKFFFGAPSCVPATTFETAGAVIDARQIGELLQREEILYLSEMMNYPGVLARDPEVKAKLAHAAKLGKPIDGHAPGLRFDDAASYADAGITTDHECVSLDEAVDKIGCGMKILIREGSAAKNFDALFPLIKRFPGQVMFCSDDKHPDDLVRGHIDEMVRRSLARGVGLFDILQAACIEPVRHYKLPVGTLRLGDPADFQIIDRLSSFRTLETVIGGQIVARDGVPLFGSVPCAAINRFECQPTSPGDFVVPATSELAARCGIEPEKHDALTDGNDAQTVRVRVIEAIDRSLLTGETKTTLPITSGIVRTDRDRDLLKLVIVNRYRPAPPAIAFIHGFGLRRGAIASSVSHDSHNILAVGGDDDEIAEAVNEVIRHRGGIVATDGKAREALPLPIAGLMTAAPGTEVAADYKRIDRFVKDHLGSRLTAPFTTLSFMSLLVIPKLKLSDLGLFDCTTFKLVGQ
jgi:adenine deaminase